MWLRLDDNQAGFLTELLHREVVDPHHVDEIGRPKVQAILDELNKGRDPDHDAFVNAVGTGDEVEVDADTVLSRGDDGAFVMAWVWVSNKEAGLPANEDEDIN